MTNTSDVHGPTLTQAVDTASWAPRAPSLPPDGPDARVRFDVNRATRLIVGATVTVDAWFHAAESASRPSALIARRLAAVDRDDPWGRS